MQSITVTVLGGGSAQARLLSLLIGLKGLLVLDGYDLHINSIVTVADDGGSAGRIRQLFGGPSLGDIVNVLASTARNRSFADTITARYGKDAAEGLAGHKIGNLILDRAANILEGGLPEAIEMLAQALDSEAAIFPSSLDSPNLCIRLSSGEIIRGEHNLDEPHHDGNLEIEDVWLEPDAQINPDARQAILESDRIIISAGDPYGSIAACLKVHGIAAALAQSQATIATVVPLFNRYGQSTNWNAFDHIHFAQDLINPAHLAAAFVNKAQASPDIRERYERDGEIQVTLDDMDMIEGVKIWTGDYLDESPQESQPGDMIRRSSLYARHGLNLIPDMRDYILG
jgi:uncharacterized cofD-like protein